MALIACEEEPVDSDTDDTGAAVVTVRPPCGETEDTVLSFKCTDEPWDVDTETPDTQGPSCDWVCAQYGETALSIGSSESEATDYHYSVGIYPEWYCSPTSTTNCHCETYFRSSGCRIGGAPYQNCDDDIECARECCRAHRQSKDDWSNCSCTT
jgi:hypothetical protein